MISTRNGIFLYIAFACLAVTAPLFSASEAPSDNESVASEVSISPEDQASFDAMAGEENLGDAQKNTQELLRRAVEGKGTHDGDSAAGLLLASMLQRAGNLAVTARKQKVAEAFAELTAEQKEIAQPLYDEAMNPDNGWSLEGFQGVGKTIGMKDLIAHLATVSVNDESMKDKAQIYLYDLLKDGDGEEITFQNYKDWFDQGYVSPRVVRIKHLKALLENLEGYIESYREAYESMKQRYEDNFNKLKEFYESRDESGLASILTDQEEEDLVRLVEAKETALGPYTRALDKVDQCPVGVIKQNLESMIKRVRGQSVSELCHESDEDDQRSFYEKVLRYIVTDELADELDAYFNQQENGVLAGYVAPDGNLANAKKLVNSINGLIRKKNLVYGILERAKSRIKEAKEMLDSLNSLGSFVSIPEDNKMKKDLERFEDLVQAFDEAYMDAVSGKKGIEEVTSLLKKGSAIRRQGEELQTLVGSTLKKDTLAIYSNQIANALTWKNKLSDAIKLAGKVENRPNVTRLTELYKTRARCAIQGAHNPSYCRSADDSLYDKAASYFINDLIGDRYRHGKNIRYSKCFDYIDDKAFMTLMNPKFSGSIFGPMRENMNKFFGQLIDVHSLKKLLVDDARKKISFFNPGQCLEFTYTVEMGRKLFEDKPYYSALFEYVNDPSEEHFYKLLEVGDQKEFETVSDSGKKPSGRRRVRVIRRRRDPKKLYLEQLGKITSRHEGYCAWKECPATELSSGGAAGAAGTPGDASPARLPIPDASSTDTSGSSPDRLPGEHQGPGADPDADSSVVRLPDPVTGALPVVTPGSISEQGSGKDSDTDSSATVTTGSSPAQLPGEHQGPAQDPKKAFMHSKAAHILAGLGAAGGLGAALHQNNKLHKLEQRQKRLLSENPNADDTPEYRALELLKKRYKRNRNWGAGSAAASIIADAIYHYWINRAAAR